MPARDVAGVGVVHQHVGGLRAGEVDDRGQRLVVDVDQFERVLGDVAALGDDERHRVADELAPRPRPAAGAGCPATSLPATACQASLTSGLRSAAVNTACTPGRASAAEVSMLLIRARANGLRTKQACSMPGREMSSTKLPWPVSRRPSSTRCTRVPAYRG